MVEDLGLEEGTLVPTPLGRRGPQAAPEPLDPLVAPLPDPDGGQSREGHAECQCTPHERPHGLAGPGTAEKSRIVNGG